MYSCRISYVVLLTIGILYPVITIYFVFSLLYPFAKTQHRGRRPRPYLLIRLSIHLPACLPIYLPTYQPTNQPTNKSTNLPTCICQRRTWCTATADAIVYWTGLEKTASVALEPISPARHHGIWCCIILYVRSVAVLFFCFEFFLSLLLFLSDSAAKTEGFISVRFSGGEKAVNVGEGRGVGATTLHNNSCCCANVCCEQCVYVRVFFFTKAQRKSY